MQVRRVIFVFRNMGTGGAQKIEAYVANLLVESGYEVIVINMSSTPMTVNLDSKIKIINLYYDEVVNCKNKLLKIFYKFKYLMRFRRCILDLNPDEVCVFLSDVVRMTVLALFGTKIPIIGSERGDPYTFTKKQFFKYKKAYMKCTYVIFQLEDVARKYSLPSCIKQKVIPNPCVPRRLNYPIRSNVCNQHVIVSAGRLVPQKRFDVLIEAFEQVFKKFPNYKLYIYGEGPLREQLEAQIKSSFASNAIKLIGDVEDVFLDAVNCEFFVLSSDFEGIPNVLLEAMAIGIPCISTDCSPGGARYLLKNGKRGIIVPCGEKTRLSEAMIEYINNPRLRELNGKKGIDVKDEFSPQVISKMWLDVF